MKNWQIGPFLMYARRKPEHYNPLTTVRSGTNFVEFWLRGNLIGICR